MSDSSWLSPENLDPSKLALELVKAVGRWDALKSYAKRNLDWIRRGETQVAVFGAGGTGKSTFAKLVVSENPLMVDSTYESDVTQKNVEFPGGISAKLLVAPGQERYIEPVWSSMMDALKKKRSVAIINVVGFGYHHFDVGSFEDFKDVYRDGMSREDFLEAYLPDRQNAELQGLRALADGLKEIETDVWMLTVVSKQDLWWDDRTEVKRHYLSEEEGHYSAILNDVAADMAARKLGFSHHFVSVSQVVSNLMGPDGEPLKTTCAGYDLDEHKKFLYNYLRRFNDLLEGNKL